LVRARDTARGRHRRLACAGTLRLPWRGRAARVDCAGRNEPTRLVQGCRERDRGHGEPSTHGVDRRHVSRARADGRSRRLRAFGKASAALEIALRTAACEPRD
jgi:hypothetical protein